MKALRFSIAVLLALAVTLLAGPEPVAVGPIGITVSDLDRSVEFFTEVLDFEKVAEREFQDENFDRLVGLPGARVREATLRLGEESIVLTEYLIPRRRPVPADSQSNDLWFQHIAIVVRDMDQAYARLRDRGVKPISTGPQQIPDWNPAAAGIRAFYFRDPDNHALELIWFPAGKGDPRWQQPTDRLFLGIDHTAIAVSDTENSLRFYRDELGLRVAGESLNYGPEQEHLNGVSGSRVRITGLRAGRGPGIEFLEYIEPGDGRPRPADAGQNDVLSWQTRIVFNDLDPVTAALAGKRAALVSPRPVEIGALRGNLVRDPDGHGIELVETTP